MHPLPFAHLAGRADAAAVDVGLAARSSRRRVQVGRLADAVVHTRLCAVPARRTSCRSRTPGSYAPPQSTSVSLPFFTPSLQVGAWQMPPVHTPLVQSPATAQPLPSAHSWARAAAAAVDVGLAAVLHAVGAAARRRRRRCRRRSTQSLAARAGLRRCRSAAQVAPPQSTSVSAPFFTRRCSSAPRRRRRCRRRSGSRCRVAGLARRRSVRSTSPRRSRRRSRRRSSRRRCRSAPAQAPPVQTPLAQSPAAAAALPVAHCAQAAAAAVDVGLAAVLRRRRCRSAPGSTCRRADAALAVAGAACTSCRRRTRRRCAAAVDVGLAAVLHAVGAAGRLADRRSVQTPLAQSPRRAQPLPSAHLSAQVAAAVDVGLGAVLHAVRAGRRLARRRCTRRSRSRWRRAHALPSAHVAQAAPPQSTSVSVPFLTPSPQRGRLARRRRAHAARAVRRPRRTSCPSAHGAARAAAVDVGLGAVLHAVACSSGSGRCSPRRRRSGSPSAPPHTLPSAHSPGTAAAAVDVGLAAVLHAVGAASRAWHALAGADAALAVSGRRAAACRRRTSGTSAPQSTSVSVPFFTPSVQSAASQLPVVQTPLVQSIAVRARSRRFARGHVPLAPPQSMSVSSPFLTRRCRSELAARARADAARAVGGRCRRPCPARTWRRRSRRSRRPSRCVHDTVDASGGLARPLVQTRLVQSTAATHFLPSAQALQPEAGPPQSTSDSVPFGTPSLQVGVLANVRGADPARAVPRRRAAPALIARARTPLRRSPRRSPAVLHLVRATRGLAAPTGTDAEHAVAPGRTALARTASRAARAPTAVLVGLAAVFHRIRATRRRTHARSAHTAFALVAPGACLAHAAGGAGRPAAIDVGFALVQDVVGATRGLAISETQCALRQSAAPAHFSLASQSGRSPRHSPRPSRCRSESGPVHVAPAQTPFLQESSCSRLPRRTLASPCKPGRHRRNRCRSPCRSSACRCRRRPDTRKP